MLDCVINAATRKLLSTSDNRVPVSYVAALITLHVGGNTMKQPPEAVKMWAFVLLIVGTLGLLLSEFVFDWGRAATLSFALANVIGLLALGFTHLGGGKARGA